MARLDYITAGESHGPAMIAVVSGLPSDLPLDLDFVNAELTRRQAGYGRSGRQVIERDQVEVLSGLRRGRTTGAPLTLLVRNRDSRLDDPARTPSVSTPRPGHADLAGSIKHLTTDCRNILERASARETAARVAAGAAARCLLRRVGIEAMAFVRSIAGVACDTVVTADTWAAVRDARNSSDTACPDPVATARQQEAIHRAKVDKTTVGGLIECHVFGVPPGIGGVMHWTDRLDARLAGAVMGVQAIKSVEIGLGRASADRPGHEVHDPIAFEPGGRGRNDLGFARATNNAGGIEAGMSNGAPIVITAAMKPISTLLRGMPSVNLDTRQPAPSAYERSDVCAVPAASVVIENVAAFEVARALREKFGGDSLAEFLDQFRRYLDLARELPLPEGAIDGSPLR